ncbi:thiaminase II [Lederbergia galactosidilytica]|uniref:Aminopyrimidine aminohydrolase n=1 Tax=Lederbergia galactosidilytica TaxID=217031 RepID=A0A178A7J2_9BACI|nr:thiaminase II [Lederbergia galactosidilytica]KRG14336.1 thiaminase [Virgibacillus soli]MBP1914438.1 thiaminase/transcriptional activator TenA [Lederbergia galactosidilytica]OAK75769.1 thiaminase [Lederbergia galactosidilytica]
MHFTDELRQATEQSWELSLHHPFVQGIVQGDLPLEKFKYYILQDIYYLKHYGKVHAMAAAQADDFSHTALLAKKAQLTAQAELTVHEEHAKVLNITKEEMEHFRPAPTAYAYTSHLYRAALSGSFAQTIAAMLPCYWLYADIGKTYEHTAPNKPIYKKWIETYASEWFQTSTQEQIDLLNQVVATASETEKEKIKEQFVIAKEYELAFWEMAYQEEKWLSEKQTQTIQS